jgi:hypothetical protein
MTDLWVLISHPAKRAESFGEQETRLLDHVRDFLFGFPQLFRRHRAYDLASYA